MRSSPPVHDDRQPHVRHLTTLLAQRDQLTETRAEASELLAFLFLLMLSAAVVAPMWLLPVPNVLRFVYAGLALAIPLTLLINQPRARQPRR